MLLWTDTLSSLIDDQATAQITDTAASFIYSIAKLRYTTSTFISFIKTKARWTHARSCAVYDVTFLQRTFGYLVTLDSCIALVAGFTFTYHRPHRQSVKHFAFPMYTARFCGIARVDARAVDTSCLRGAFGVGATAHVVLLAAQSSITHISRGTNTLGPMIVHSTFSWAMAWTSFHTRVATLGVDASSTWRTFRI